MIADKLTAFATALAVNMGAAGTYLLGNQIDTGAAGEDQGMSGLYLVIVVNEKLTSGAGGTIQFKLASDSTAAVDTATSTVHVSSGAIAVGVTGIEAGEILFCAQLPHDGAAEYEQFLGLLQTTGTAAMTAGKVDAFLTHDPALWKATPANTGA